MNLNQQLEFIVGALKQPATMALIKLETQKENVDFLREAHAAEKADKCRWQVLNQIRQWLAESGEKP